MAFIPAGTASGNTAFFQHGRKMVRNPMQRLNVPVRKGITAAAKPSVGKIGTIRPSMLIKGLGKTVIPTLRLGAKAAPVAGGFMAANDLLEKFTGGSFLKPRKVE